MQRHFLAAALVLALTACASTSPMHEAEKLALYRQHAGEPVKSFRFFQQFTGWTPLGDRALVVWTRPSQAYLLGFNGSCPDLDFAQAISVSSQFETVYARFDSVTPLTPGTMTVPCRIQEIRPLDVAAIRDAERERRAGAQAAVRKEG